MKDINEASSALNCILFADEFTFIKSINAVFPNKRIDKQFEHNINLELEKYTTGWLSISYH